MKSFIITMLGHEMSEQLSAECRQQAAKFGINVEIFEAIWGRDYEQHLEKLKIKLGKQKLAQLYQLLDAVIQLETSPTDEAVEKMA